jgi:hypothetical protein
MCPREARGGWLVCDRWLKEAPVVYTDGPRLRVRNASTHPLPVFARLMSARYILLENSPV